MANKPNPTKTRAEILAEFYGLQPSDRINEEMLAAVLLCSVAKLQRDRVFGGGIPFIREGGKLKADKNGQTRIFGGRVFYMTCRIECMARLFAQVAFANKQSDLAEALNAIAVDVDDIRAFVHAWGEFEKTSDEGAI